MILALEDEVPHVLVRSNSVRGLKTKASIRSVPLVDDALAAAKEALDAAELGKLCSPDMPVSGALMRPLRP